MLVVDYIGVKYTGKENTKQHMSALKEDYKISTDWGGGGYWTDLGLGLPSGQGILVNDGVCGKRINTAST